MASSRGPLTPGRKSRRSWFDTPPLVSLDPKPAQDENARPKKCKRRSIDTVETLTLTHFTSAPRLGFGNAVVGSIKFRTLIVRNPHDYEQEVIIEKFPFKKKFYVDHTRFEVAPGDVFSLEITWTPEEATSVREMVQFHINGVYRLQCYLFGTAENPKPVRKARRRKVCPPVDENRSVVIQTPALSRIKSSYNPRRSQEMRDLQALVENKEFHHNNSSENTLKEEQIISLKRKAMVKEYRKTSPPVIENQENVFVRPNPIDPVTPTVLESTAIGAGLKQDVDSSLSSRQTRTKWEKMASANGGDNENSMASMSPIPVVSDGNHNVTVDSFFRPSEMGTSTRSEGPSHAGEHGMKDTFVVPKVPLSQPESDFPRLTFVCPVDLRSKDVTEKGQFLSSTVCVPSNSDNNREMTYNVDNCASALTLEACRSNVFGADMTVTTTSDMSPSSARIEFSKRVEWQSPQRGGKLNSSSDLSSMSPNTILDQSLSFIAQVCTPVKLRRRNHPDMDVSGNCSLISAGQGLVSPNSFMEEMNSSRLDGSIMIDGAKDSSIPSPSAVFNNSIPHNVMIKHLDNINTSLLSNSPLFQATKPSLKSKGATKRRSLATAYRVAERKKTGQVKKSPLKSGGNVDRRPYERRVRGTENSKGVKDATRKRYSPVKRSMKVQSFRRSPLTKNIRQKMRRSPGKKAISPIGLKGRNKNNIMHLDDSTWGTPVKKSPKIIDSGTVVKNQSSNSFSSPSLNPDSSPNFTPISPSCLPTTADDDPNISSRRCTLTVTKSRPSDALLAAMNNNRKKLFDFDGGIQQTFVPFIETSDESTGNKGIDGNGSLESVQKGDERNPASESQEQQSPSGQFFSPTHRKLPNSPNPDHSRRSTHIVKSPKVLDLSTFQQKRLDFDLHSDDIGNTDTTRSDDDTSTTLSLETEIKSKQNSPITSVCAMSPRVVDYEISSEEGSTSRQSVSIDSLDTSQYSGKGTASPCDNDLCKGKAPVALSGFECEYRVDVLNDTRSEEGVNFTKLKTPRSDLDWSFCERGDTKVLPSKMDFDSNLFSGEMNEKDEIKMESVDCVVPASKSSIVDGLSTTSNKNSSEISREETIPKKKLHATITGMNQVKKSKGPVKAKEVTQSKGPVKAKGVAQSKGPVKAKGLAQSKLILVKKAKNAVPRHPMPFAARNMYYDERWMEKQENGFVQWLNFVLTPPDEYVAVTSKPKVDAVALTLGNQQQGVPARLAPTKEVLSFRAYAARRRLNRLRRAACQLYQSDEVAGIIRKIEVEVESQRIAARKDRKLHADLGIKKQVLDLLLQYNPLWLRIGLETVFGEVLPLHSNTDVVGLSRFVVTRLLSCPDIAAEYAHPSVPHLYTEGYATAMSRHSVKKFLLLIYFMDKGKTLRLIDHDPCLFCKDADIKSSKEILIQFSRGLLSGEGDLTRHLAYLGYTVCQMQKPFDEFDYAVTKISSDLKDGLRLSRLLELLAGDSCIMGKLRTPAISRLQKIHNMEVFFSAMLKRGFNLEDTSGTKARDVVDGHREKTLSVLWHLILHFQANLNVDEEKLKEEIYLLTKSLRLKLAMQKIGAAFTEDCLARRDSGDSTTFVNNERMQLIFQWCRLVCLHYGVKIENMTVSFSDGRALCCLLHHYHPVLLPLSDIRFHTTQQFQQAAEEMCDGDDPDLSVDWGKRGGLCPNEDDPAYFDKLLVNEKWNFKILYEKVSALGGVPLMVKHTHMSNTIPDEKVVTTYVSYLCLRLLDIREEVKAARVIQMAWRRRKLQQTFKQRLWAAQIIQRSYRKYLESKRVRERLIMEERKREMECAVVKLQAVWRGCLERKRLRRSKAVIVLQSFWQMKKAQKVLAELRCQKERGERFRRETQAALTIQKMFRVFLVREDMKHVRKCAIVLQSLWRMRKAKHAVAVMRAEKEMKENEERLRQEDLAAVTIQRFYRGFFVRKELHRLEHCVTILQSLWRKKKAVRVVAEMKFQRERVVKEKAAAVTIQKCYRGFMIRKEVSHVKHCVQVLQSLWRMKKAKRVVTEMRLQKERRENAAAVTIQKSYRGFKVRKEQKRLVQCALVLQCWWRVSKAKRVVNEMRLRKAEKEVRESFAAVKIQKCFRGFKVREEVKRMNSCATVLQCCWRVYAAKKVFEAKCQKRDQDVKEDKSAVAIQKNVRGWLCRREMCRMQDAAICIQKSWRGYLGRGKAALVLKELQVLSAIVIQKFVRSWICRQRFQQKQKAAICIQRMWRAVLIGRYLEQEEERRHVAAIVIQAWYKKCSQQEKYQTLKSSVIFIQRKHRAIVMGNEVRAELERKTNAVVSLQKAWRQFIVMKEAKSLLKEKKDAKRERERQRKVTAAILIQSHYRGYRCRQDIVQMKSACVKIQSLWRMQKAKKVLQILREEKVERATEMVCKTVMAFYHFRRFQKTKQAALVIQKNWRMCLAMRQLSLLKHTRNEKAAATCIQKNYRAHVSRRDFLRVKKAAETLQIYWRCYLIRRELIQMQMKKNQQERAACILQAFVRGALQRRNFLRIKNAASVLQEFYHNNLLARRQKEQDAATVIQSAFRGYLCRGKYRAQREAASCIQDWFRRSRAMEMERLKFLESRSSAVTIQSYFRMCICRKEFLRKQEAVVKLQACVRRFQAEEQYHLKRNAALVIQMHFRAWKSGQIFRQAYNLIRNSCITIQRFYRREKARKEMVGVLYTQNAAAVRIQACYRRHSQQKSYLVMKSAAQCIQRKYRSILKRREIQLISRKRTEAAVVIQNSWRQFAMIKEAKNVVEEKRKENRLLEERRAEEMNRRNDAVIVVQRSWRKLKLMREARREVEERKKQMEEDRVKKEELLRNAAASVIQQTYKQYKSIQETKIILGKKRDAAMRLEQHRKEEREWQKQEQKRKEATTAATVIQRWWRIRLRLRREEKIQKKEQLKSVAASVIQKAYKQFKLMHEAKLILEGRKWGRRMEEERERREEAASICIQMKWRQRTLMREEDVLTDGMEECCMKHAREDCEEGEPGKEQNQQDGDCAEERRSGASVEDGGVVKASEIIQRNVRDFLNSQQEEGRERMDAATIIQKYFRGYHQRCEFSRTIRAIVIIQSHVRAFIQRTEFEAYRASVCLIQRRWRERILTRCLREKFLCQVKAVCVIQSWYRQARAVKREGAATRIQALWRGHCVRRNLKCKKLAAARKRLLEANRSDDKNTLGSRTASALAYLLADNDMAYVLSALMNLEVSTRLSTECCERLIEASAVRVLVKLLSCCNRSVPHMEIIKYTTDILLNLANYNKTVNALMEVDNMAPVVLNIMQIFREKGAIFYKSCALLGTLAKDPDRRQALLKCPQLIDRVRSMHSLAVRKQRSADRRQQKTPAKSAKAKTKEFTDPVTAISFVMTSLKLG